MALFLRNVETGEREKIYGLLDTGADRDYLSLELARRLGIQLEESEFPVASFEEVKCKRRDTATFVIESILGDYEVMIEDALVGRFPEAGRDLPPSKRNWQAFEHLEDLEFIDIPARVEMIISVAHSDAWTPNCAEEVRKGLPGQPTAIWTKFGWTVQGVAGRRDNSRANIALLSTANQQLDDKLNQLLETDFPFILKDEKTLSKDAQHALQQMRDSIKWNIPEEKYSLALPHRVSRERTKEIVSKVDSKSTAVKRAWALKRSMNRLPEKRKKHLQRLRSS